MYFTGLTNNKKAYLGTNILETNRQIRSITQEKSMYIGGYKGLDDKVVLESVEGVTDTFDISMLWHTIAKNEESIYKCNVVSKVKIGSLRDSKYLIATIYDLMCSLTEPMQGFTIQNDDDDFYLLICNQGEYIMNPNYNKENQDAIK